MTRSSVPRWSVPRGNWPPPAPEAPRRGGARQATSEAKIREQEAEGPLRGAPSGERRDADPNRWEKHRLTEALREQAIVRAPVAGRILEVAVQPGEAIARGPVVKLAPDGPMFVVAEIFEADWGRIRNGQTATAEGRASTTSRGRTTAARQGGTDRPDRRRAQASCRWIRPPTSTRMSSRSGSSWIGNPANACATST